MSLQYTSRMLTDSGSPTVYPFETGNNFNFAGSVPYISGPGSDTVVVVFNPATSYWFEASGGGYVPKQSGVTAKLVLDEENEEYRLSLKNGMRYRFDLEGNFKSKTSPSGATANVSMTPAGRIERIEETVIQGGETVAVRHDFERVASGYNAGKVRSVTTGYTRNPTTPLRRTIYAYYEPGEEHGNAGDLKTATDQLLSGTAWVDKNVSYYRYYKPGEPNGFASGMKYSLGPDAYERLVRDPQVADPFLATDAQVAKYADNYYEYDANHRATKSVVRGGLSTYTYAYTESGFADGYDVWKLRTAMTNPDGSQLITYSNYIHETLLTELVSGSDSWIEYWRYDGALQVLHVHPSAVESYDDTEPDLGVSMKASEGLIDWTEYYASTTATPTTPGGVEHYRKSSGVQEGESGTPIKTSEVDYIERTADDETIYPTATSKTFRETNGTGEIETSYAYTWHTGTLQIERRTTTLPVVPFDQNGNDEVETTEEIYDADGFLEWTRDARGFIGYLERDWVTGSLVRQIQDVDDAKMTVPSGWSTPPGGGLHLVTDYESDAFGRTTRTLGPTHDVDGQSVRTASWAVYRDLEDETWTAPGYVVGDEGSYVETLVNPVSISRRSADGLTADSISAVRSGKANAGPCAARDAGIVESPGRLSTSDVFPQACWVRWSRSIADRHGRTLASRVYHAIPDVGEGALGVNYDETIYGYDAMIRQNRIVSASGTISRTVFDVRARSIANWIGTTDAKATAADPSGGGASGNDMVVASESVYDGGASGGDGNLTQSIEYVDATTTRVTDYEYDFRNRQTVVNGEIDFWQETFYDNLNRTIRVDQRDMDSEGNLVARQEMLYDDRGRTYRTIRYEVDPATGTVGNSLVDDMRYDADGNVVESRPSGSSAVTLSVYDGVGRRIASYVGYLEGSSSSGMTALDDLIVFEQLETAYDPAGKDVFRKACQRWHDATGAGALQGQTGSQPKSRDTYRTSWYDGIGRHIATANYGTNADAGPPVRPDSPPASTELVLVSGTRYNDRGEAFESIAANGRIDRSYADDAGRQALAIQNYVPTEDSCWKPGNDENLAVERVYLSGGRQSQLIVHNPSTGPQITRYEYGVTLAGSAVASNDLLAAEIYPDSSKSSDRVTYAYDRQSELIALRDQNGTLRTFEYDELGRKTADVVIELGSGIDGAVRRIGWTYEVRGMVDRTTSYSDAAGISVSNEVANVYNGFGQLIAQYQQYDGAVNPSTSPKVEYAYADGSANTIRATSVTYPDGAVLEYLYDDDAADALSRVRTVRFDSLDVCRYDYLGLGTFVRASYLQPEVRLNYVSGSGANPYGGIDRFGRVVDQLWENYDAETDVVRLGYGYDRSSNRLWREDFVAASYEKDLDELYRYDGLDRLIDFARGDLTNGHATIDSPNWKQDWKLDAVGNWNNFSQATADPGQWLDQQRETNAANEITDISRTVGAEWATPTYDAAGNMASLPKWTDASNSYGAAWDAWNRLVRVEELGLLPGKRAVQNFYDGENRRIFRQSSIGGTILEWRRYLYSAPWNVVEELVRVDVEYEPERRYVYGQRYVDDVVLRDRALTPGEPLDERLYALQDANWNVVALCEADGTARRRYTYLPYGEDLGYEGDFADHEGFNYLWTRRFGSYEFDIDLELCLARNRWYDLRLGNWISRDPAHHGYNIYAYASSRPLGTTDASGLVPQQTIILQQEPKSNPWPNADIDLWTQITSIMNCGKIHWGVIWRKRTPYPQGDSFLLQEVNFIREVRNCDGTPHIDPDGTPAKYRSHYWEAWPLPRDGQKTQVFLYDPFGNDGFGDKLERDCTTGYSNWIARYQLILGAIPNSMQTHQVPMAWNMRASFVDPIVAPLVADETAWTRHVMKIKWDCCGANCPADPSYDPNEDPERPN